MKKPVALCIIFLAAGLSFGNESNSIDFITSLNKTISQSDFFKSNSAERILFLPSFYFSRRYQIYASFGLVLPQMYETNPFKEENMPNTLLNAAFFLRYKKNNIILFLEYFRDDSWGLSVKLRF